MVITSKHRKIPLVGLFVIAAVIAVILGNTRQTTIHAADTSSFDPGNIMSDTIMANKSTMSIQQIQAFLESKNACNNTNTYMAAWYPHLQYTIRDGKFVCMAKDSFDGQSAAQIIWQVAQDYDINPQVLIVLLEKEQGLVTDTWPNNIQYRSASVSVPVYFAVFKALIKSAISRLTNATYGATKPRCSTSHSAIFCDYL